ncbi:MAG: hypothetical protein ACYC6Y_11245 [Thermoguttaceae bacterium]
MATEEMINRWRNMELALLNRIEGLKVKEFARSHAVDEKTVRRDLEFFNVIFGKRIVQDIHEDDGYGEPIYRYDSDELCVFTEHLPTSLYHALQSIRDAQVRAYKSRKPGERFAPDLPHRLTHNEKTQPGDGPDWVS